MNMKKSIIRNYLFLSLLSGICMGIIFPFFSGLFTSYNSITSHIIFSVSCIGAGLAVGFISFFIGKITIIKSIRKLFFTFEKISHGDLTSRCRMQSADELGQLASDFNLFLDHMEDIIRQNQSSMEIIENLSKNLKDIASANEHIAEEIVAGTTTMAEDAVLENEQLSHIRTQLSSGNDSIDLGHKQASDMLESSTTSFEVARKGKEDMTEILSQFEWVADTISYAKDSIEALGKRSLEISDIADFITEIAEETNLLAFNAAIESARAGEAGKGFAIVSEQISKLSEQTKNASAKIFTMLSQTRSETDSAMHNMDQNLSKINVQLSSITNSMVALESIVCTIKNTKTGANEVLKIYQNIAAMFYSLEENVQKINDVIENNATYSQQVVASTQEQQHTVHVLNESADKLFNIVREMREKLSYYKTV